LKEFFIICCLLHISTLHVHAMLLPLCVAMGKKKAAWPSLRQIFLRLLLYVQLPKMQKYSSARPAGQTTCGGSEMRYFHIGNSIFLSHIFLPLVRYIFATCYYTSVILCSMPESPAPAHGRHSPIFKNYSLLGFLTRFSTG
jgi:hypothetical protein